MNKNILIDNIMSYLEDITSKICRKGFTIEAAEYISEENEFLKVVIYNPEGEMVKGSLELIRTNNPKASRRDIIRTYFNLLNEGLLK